MNHTFPIPVQTPPLADDKRSFSEAWLRFFKGVSDDLVTACLPSNAKETQALKYVVNGNLCFATYWVETPGTADIQIKLPFTALFAFDINGVVYPPNTTVITIPGNTQYLRFYFVCSFKQ